MSASNNLVQKLWNYCNIRDDGLAYGDYVDQLTFLLVPKLRDEQTKPLFHKTPPNLNGFRSDVATVDFPDRCDFPARRRIRLQESVRRSAVRNCDCRSPVDMFSSRSRNQGKL